MSLKGLRVASKLALCASLALLTMGPLMAKVRSEGDNPDLGGGHRRSITHFKRITLAGESNYYRIFEKAQCTADCGDGTGWICTGPSVNCQDGVGCSATDGTHTASGSCGAI